MLRHVNRAGSVVCHDASPLDVDCKSAVDLVKYVDEILIKSGREAKEENMARRKSGTFDNIGIENTNMQSLNDVFQVFSSKTFPSRNQGKGQGVNA